MSATLETREHAPEQMSEQQRLAAERRGRLIQGLRRFATRLIGSLIVVWVAATITFLIQALLPGDRATLLLNTLTGQIQERTAEELAPINEKFRFDDPLIVQYLNFIGGLFKGDLGISFQLYKPVTDVIGEQVGPTLLLTFAALVVAWVLALLVQVATVHRVGWVERLFSGFEALAAAMPQYLIGVVLLVTLGMGLGWFPVVSGAGLSGLILPALTLGIPLAGFLGQTIRTEFKRTLEQPFILSARARGSSDTGVRVKHAVRHSVLPGLTLTGWAVGALISGAVIAESVFSRPGLGRVLVTAVNSRDLPVVCGLVILVAVIYVVANLVVDTVYQLVDPRLQDRD